MAESRYQSLRAAFDARVIRSEFGCWGWRGVHTGKGYATFKWGSRQFSAHRVSHELFNGPIAEGMLVMHSCDNRECTNPEHLSEGTEIDNAQDAKSKGRHAHGNTHFAHKLTEDMIPLIRDLSREGVGQDVIAALCGVAKQTISHVVSGDTWGHI